MSDTKSTEEAQSWLLIVTESGHLHQSFEPQKPDIKSSEGDVK